MGGEADIGEAGKATAPAGAKPNFFQRTLAHYKKWWWVHLIIMIVVLLVTVLPITYVAYPNIGQHDINKATFNATKLEVTDPDTDSFQTDFVAKYVSNVHITPTLYGFNSTIAMNGGPEFATVHIPTMKISGGSSMEVNERITLSNQTAFTELAKAAVHDEEVTIRIYGKPHLKWEALPKIQLTLNKTITTKGLNNLSGANLTNYDFSLTKDSAGNNLNGTAYIPNPSVMSVQLGNVSLGLSVEGTSIGSCQFNDLTIAAGDNYVPMTASIDDTAVAKILPNYKNGTIPISATGQSVVYNGQNITYLSEALQSTSITLDVDIYQGLNKLLESTVTSMLSGLTSATGLSLPTLSL